MSDYADQTVAVLAVQGAFAEHEARLSELGARCIELRQAADLKQDFDRLVLPGGESTVQGKLLDELGMLEELRTRIVEGMPVLGTCAGLILLAHDLAAHDDKGTPRLATMDVLVERNAYGRQLGSFRTKGQVAGIDGEVPLTFIRAPRIVEVHGRRKGLSESRRPYRRRAPGQPARRNLPPRTRRRHPPPRTVPTNVGRKQTSVDFRTHSK